MALINCPECAREVSSKAPTCPNCGAPISAAPTENAVGVNLATVQATSKKLKFGIIQSAFLFWGGLIWILVADSSLKFLGGLSMLLGFVLWLLVRAQIWWHHK